MPRCPAAVALGVVGVLLLGCQSREADVAVSTDSIASTSDAGPRATGPSRLAFTVPAAVAGHLQHVGLRLKFIACGGSGDARSLEDNATDDAMTLLRALDGADNGLNVVLRVNGDRIEQVRYGAVAGVGCERLPPDGELEARGNEPFWALRIAGDSARITTPAEPDGVPYMGGRWEHIDNTHWTYAAQRAAGPRDTLHVAVTEAPCTDSMSGARYPFQVTVTRVSLTLSGCALEGRQSFPP